ncbi:hydroxyphenylacetyl-CoA thioesterase PaaI [Tateyamaria sp. SN6-1]|uniref:hydroxyphenylacetyl-CoA thioesterase PaaI n=1 Tax=Tateyamaria sp. SN6-1 TaxID=3092148 RepID=UPI0039F4BA27
MTPQARAEQSAQALWAGDHATQSLGMTLQDIAPGRAALTMTVRDDMLNGHGICHGGYIFTLADSAFAFACNSYNQCAVAQTNQITYVTPARPGEALTATATEAARAGRSGTYDVTVTGDDGRTVALFRGQSRTIKGQHFDEDTQT